VPNFYPLIDLSDLTEVNGKPAQGVVVLRGVGLNLSKDPQPGQAIAYGAGRVAVYDFNMDLQHPDGSPIGTLVGSGLGGGPPAPGLPHGFGSLAITGGTGVFLGARGQIAFIGPQSSRRASMAEDPANRRSNGGGSPGGWLIDLVPMFRPRVVATNGSPTLLHSDNLSPVTNARPARSGEVLIAAVKGLGPVRANVSPGQPFGHEPPAEVIAPVSVLVDKTEAVVISAIGWPGFTDRYKIAFQMPERSGRAMARVQIISAWVPGREFMVPVR
jgi:uncharacterized protein (TIGR03437 family)